jgi:hypothetical protein
MYGTDIVGDDVSRVALRETVGGATKIAIDGACRLDLTGTITRLGLDIGFSAGGKLVRGVFARRK